MVDAFVVVTIYAIVLVPLMVYLLKNYTVVRLNEIHIVTGRRLRIYDGMGRYFFYPFLGSRVILPNNPIDIENTFSVTDKFGKSLIIEYGGIIQVTGAELAARNLENYDINSLKTEMHKIVEYSIKSEMQKLAIEELRENLSKITNDVSEYSTTELEKFGIDVSRLLIVID